LLRWQIIALIFIRTRRPVIFIRYVSLQAQCFAPIYCSLAASSTTYAGVSGLPVPCSLRSSRNPGKGTICW